MTTGAFAQDQQAIALAMLFVALKQVVDVAAEGRWDDTVLQTCLRGLLNPPEETLQELYTSPDVIRAGLRQLQVQLSRQPDLELTRYAVAVINLERRLMKQQAVLRALAAGLDKARQQYQYFEGINATVIASLADVYTSHISNLGPRIVVRGRREWLEDASRAARIRCLLLAAIRAISFWRSAGGNRLQLIIGRRRLEQTCTRLLADGSGSE